MFLPKDFLDEVEIELRGAHRATLASHERATALEALHTATLEVARRLNRPITVFDLIRSAAGPVERARLKGLVSMMRSAG